MAKQHIDFSATFESFKQRMSELDAVILAAADAFKSFGDMMDSGVTEHEMRCALATLTDPNPDLIRADMQMQLVALIAEVERGDG